MRGGRGFTLMREGNVTRERALFHLEMDGWCVLEGIIPPQDVDHVRECVAATVTRHRNPEAPPGIGHVSGLIAVDQSVAGYLADYRILEIVAAVFGPHARISMTSAMVNFPGNGRGGWHADWPFNQRNAGHIPVPYPDTLMHLTSIWMLSEFTAHNGGTLVVPGSHRMRTNPTAACGIAADQPYPSEIQITGAAGSVMLFDSRLWHASAPNYSDWPRVALAVRYAPWWLNLEPLMPGSDERQRLVEESGLSENQVPPVPRRVFDALPDAVKPLYRHWVRN
jgi:hypothetical protein